MATVGNDGLAGTMAIEAAESGGDANRPAKIAAEVQGGKSCRQTCRATGTAAGGAGEIEGIIGAAIDGIVGVEVGQPGADVGLADDDGAGGSKPGDSPCVALGDVAFAMRHAGGGREALDIDRFLDGDRDAEPGRRVAAGKTLVSRVGVALGALDVFHDN